MTAVSPDRVQTMDEFMMLVDRLTAPPFMSNGRPLRDRIARLVADFLMGEDRDGDPVPVIEQRVRAQQRCDRMIDAMTEELVGGPTRPPREIARAMLGRAWDVQREHE